jgi:N-acetylneuraminic acid mutarotase
VSMFRVAGKWLAAFVLVTITAGFSSCGGGGGNPPDYVLQGSVSGLLPGHSVVLQNFGSNTITVSANGNFQFSTPMAGGAPYSVSVLTQPSGETCAPTNGSGTGTAGPGSSVDIVCTYPSFTIGGEVYFGFPSVVLQLNGGDDTTVLFFGTGSSYQFSELLPIGTPYAVTVATQPPGLNCTVAVGSDPASGIANSNISSVVFGCAPVTYTIGGAVSGLSAGNSVVLEDNGGNATTVSANVQFTFSTTLAYQSPYAVTVATQPAGQNCLVTNGSGTVAATNVANVAIACAAANYTIGGIVSGVTAGNSVVLEDNGGNATTVSINGAFTFTTTVAYQSPYAVTVSTQPTGQSCSVNNASGTVAAANVTSVTVVCTSTVDAGLWTWQSGSNTTANSFLGVYGTLGTAAPGNFPGGRGDAAFTWTDGAGNLWMFGGGGPGNSGVGGLFSDLWRYNVSTALWAWMSGADTLGAQSVYGTLGTPGAGNVPSAREGGASWIDGAGNLWLFGGGGFDSTGHEDLGLSDLWRFSPSTGLWTWMNGPTTGNMVGLYGTQGTPAPANVPGGRTALVSFKDSAGNFWLFGGAGFDSVGNGNSSLNDLWRYSPSNGMWTWMGGSNRGNAKGVYGTQGTPAAGNVPGARSGAVSWTDGAGNFWLFGGSGYDSTGSNTTLNDLWRYSPSSGMWTWMSGSNLGNVNGMYGTLGTRAAGNIPGARSSAVSWLDSAGNFWLFGGFGNDAIGNEGVLNDLWRYSPGTNLWTWTGGSATQGAAGVYGTEGTAAPGNIPGARQFASSWTDGGGNLWLFGGDVPAALNDLWQYVPPPGP